MSYLYKDKIESIFNTYPIYTNIIFRIGPTKDNILDKMFSDLYYTGQVGRTYANSPYNITSVENYYRAQIRDVVDGNIYPLKTDPHNDNFVYLVEGYYDTFVTLRGKMIVDITYVDHRNYVGFEAKAFVIIDNNYMWRLARYIKSLPSFEARVNKLIESNVRATIRLGVRTVRGIKKDLKGKDY